MEVLILSGGVASKWHLDVVDLATTHPNHSRLITNKSYPPTRGVVFVLSTRQIAMATYAAHLRGVVARGHHYQVRSGGGNVDVFLAAEATKAAAIRPAVRAAAERKAM